VVFAEDRFLVDNPESNESWGGLLHLRE